jgi:1-deoxy-D-xylulose-5-phosphate reductoisomerase
VHPAVFNAANEECVAAFLGGRLPFLAIVDTVAAVVAEADDHDWALGNSLSVADVLSAEGWARQRARDLTRTTGTSGAADPAATTTRTSENPA